MNVIVLEISLICALCKLMHHLALRFSIYLRFSPKGPHILKVHHISEEEIMNTLCLYSMVIEKFMIISHIIFLIAVTDQHITSFNTKSDRDRDPLFNMYSYSKSIDYLYIVHRSLQIESLASYTIKWLVTNQHFSSGDEINITRPAKTYI